jgi:Ferritin-like domain
MSGGAGSTRRGLVLAAGAVPLAHAAAAAAAPRSDLDVLERLLTRERRLEAAYDAALRRGALSEPLALALRDQEREHARGLEMSLTARGGRAPRAPERDPALAASLRSRDAFARYALRLEGRTVRAYVDALAGLRDARLLKPLGAIMASEAQHEVALRRFLGEPLLGV